MKILILNTKTGGMQVKYDLYQIAMIAMDVPSLTEIKSLPSVNVLITAESINSEWGQFEKLTNSGIIDKVKSDSTSVSPDEASTKLNHFITSNFPFEIPLIQIAGSHVEHDLKFIRKYLPNCLLKKRSFYIPFDILSHYIVPNIDTYVPTIEKCLERTGKTKQKPSNDAIEDCIRIAHLIKFKYPITN